MRYALALLLALSSSALSAADFRSSDWGDSVDQVRAVETATFHHQREGELAFVDDAIDGIDGGVIYLFEGDALVRGVYVSRDPYPGGEGALDDYARLIAHLDELMGSEGVETLRWSDESLRAEPSRLAEAISKGHVRVSRRWARENTHIDLVMSGREGGIYLRALFQPRI